MHKCMTKTNGLVESRVRVQTVRVIVGGDLECVSWIGSIREAARARASKAEAGTPGTRLGCVNLLTKLEYLGPIKMNIGKGEEREKSKGISLRKKRTVKPKVSAPKISGPLPTGVSADSNSRPKVGPDGGLPSGPRPRPRPKDGDTTADLVKRRYSTRFANLPSDFGSGPPPIPSMPKISNEFAVQPPSRDGVSTGQRIKIDAKALADPSLQADQCKTLFWGNA